MKKKFVIILLILLVVTGCGKRKNENVVEEKREIVTREVNDSEQEVIMKEIDDLEYLDYYAKSFKVNELTNQEVLQFIYYLYKDNVSKSINFKALEEYLGNYMEFPLEPENILCNTHFNRLGGSDYIYLYNIYNDNYEDNKNHYVHPRNGFGSDVFNKYISGKVEDDKYTIRVYKVFSTILNEQRDYKVSFYRSYSESEKKENSVFNTTYSGRYAVDIVKEMDKYNDLYVYEYVFKKVNDKYLLVSYTINPE